jgi:hypothetical protein
MIYIIEILIIGLMNVGWEVGMANQTLMSYVATKEGTNLVVKFNNDAHGEKYIYIDDKKAFLYCESATIAEIYTGKPQNYTPLEIHRKNGMIYVGVNIHIFEIFVYQNEIFQHYQNLQHEKINGMSFGRGSDYYQPRSNVLNYCNL